MSSDEHRRRLLAEAEAFLASLPPEKRAAAEERLMSLALDLMTRAQLLALREQLTASPHRYLQQPMLDMIDGQLALLALDQGGASMSTTTAAEIQQLKFSLLEAESRLAKAEKAVAEAHVDILVLRERLKMAEAEIQDNEQPQR